MTTAIAHVERAHSKLGGSKCEIYWECEASVQMAAKCPPSQTSEAAKYGTAAHELAEIVFKEAPNARYYIGKRQFNGYEVTEEMADDVQDYVDYVRVIKNRLKADLHIEMKIHLKHIHPDMFGSCDAIASQPFGELHVFDFKYGFHAVDVERNKQVMFYALGAMRLEDYSKIILHICQPRAFHEDGRFRSWETTPEELLEFGKELKRRAAATEKANPAFKAGSWCFWCPAAGACPELKRTAQAAAKADFENVVTMPKVSTLSLEQVGKIIENGDLIRAFLKSAEEYALAKMVAGEKVPGVKLVRGRGKREWASEKEAGKFLEEKLGKAAFKTSLPKLLTVAQAEKFIPKADLGSRVRYIEGGYQVAPESDKRAGVADGKTDFASIQAELFSEHNRSGNSNFEITDEDF